jgi:hypothetical protein
VPYQAALIRLAPLIKFLVLVAAVLQFWNRPVAQLPSAWLWPLNRFLGIPHSAVFAVQARGFATGCVAAGPFVYLSVRACNAIAQAMLPARKSLLFLD